jgi:H+-transporting ATPase
VKAEAPPNLTPQLVQRVHALYEELGRQDVLAVLELERAEQESKNHEPRK